MGYEGHAGAPIRREERERLTDEAMKTTMEAVRLINKEGIEVKEVSVGSTPTVWYSSSYEGVTEIQPGTYVFNDYYLVERGVVPIERCALHVLATVMSRAAPDRGVIDAGSKAFQLDMNRYPITVDIEGVEVIKFSEEHGWLKITGEAQNKPIERCALHVLATVMSRAAPDRGVIDAGSKAFQLDMNRYPITVDIEGVEVIKFSEEHGWLKITGEAQNKVKLGDKLEFIPYHVCTCVNQFDTMYITKNNKVLHEYQIKARGKML